MRRFLVPAASVLAALAAVLGWSQLPDSSGSGSEPRPELTIEVGGVAVRIANLDCAESDTEAGQRAGERMTRLVQGQAVTCELEGRQSYDREVGTCTLASTGQDVGEVLILEDVCPPWEPIVPYLPHYPTRQGQP